VTEPWDSEGSVYTWPPDERGLYGWRTFLEIRDGYPVLLIDVTAAAFFP
jgi:hypothetical protein